MRRVTDFEGEIARLKLRIQLKLSCHQSAQAELVRLRALIHRKLHIELRQRRKEKAA
jgi:hypothetical protein